MLQGHKQNVLKLQRDIVDAKQEYHTALRNLETISDSIHELRSNKTALLQPRGQGVGAETPDRTCLYKVESERSEHISVSTQVEEEMESAIRSLALECPTSGDGFIEHNEVHEEMEEVNKCLGNEVSLHFDNGDNELDDNQSSLLETPPCLRREPLESKLFVSPLTPEQLNGDEHSSVHLEKWFFFRRRSRSDTDH